MADEKKSKTSLAQKVADFIATPAGGPGLWDVLTSRLLYDEDDEHHPKGERRGSVENLIKALGLKYGTLVSPDMRYLEQYLHPDSDILPRTKPPGFKPGTIPYREPFYEGNANTKVVNTEGLGRFAYMDPATGEFSPASNTDARVDSPRGSSMSHVFDVWDFDTSFGMLKDGSPTVRGGESENNLGSEVIKRIMRASGQPYAIYGPEKKDK